MDSKLVYWSQFLFLLLSLFVIIHNNLCHFMCITVSSFGLENYAVQKLTISSYPFLQPRLEVVHWVSYHVGGYCRDFMFYCNFQFMNCTWFIDEYLLFYVTQKEIIAYTQVRWPSRPWKITALGNDMPRKDWRSEGFFPHHHRPN
jgi:hypothetical protein